MGIALKQLSYTYQEGTPFEGAALFDVNIEIPSGSYTALIGHTGSGKSTILQLLNGLLLPSRGEVQMNDLSISSESSQKELKNLRKKVGLVFQFPESQLFAETVVKDVAFGPQNFGVDQESAERLAKEKLQLVGLSEDLFERSPFELSGGQMRRVAIAGILAMEPEILVLDEPTAGLDPLGRRELMKLFASLHRAGMTIILVSHSMEDVAEYANFVYVLEKGRIVMSGHPKEVFQDVEGLEQIQLGVPKVTKFAWRLRNKGLSFPTLPITLEEFKELIGHE
ncbi:energy-coupling factor ABC transporter ATP-binding protein [Streptococcus rubneri]|jgi:cobalt import ATP-binding protein cbiO 1|uniref:Energy-coupling factor transporter ATP-binding protein EcfA2 n=1 Tax=Streptococcus rubneri TaxID=1234680 RepID=A0A4Z1DXA5_9STRE|nr:energy-coupling factor ABC transporter ATP-binding protein [Streptococcus rubneri]MBK4773460.1 energy-coupling factor ABC transporter ATP-binding protein [Streptococcus rubneri]TGN92827.1 energy-coupling factor transporter ATPase [Streptococcus rubneri]